MRVTISNKSARIRFHGCTTEYINNVCHGRCCDNRKNNPRGTPVSEAEGKVLLGFPNVRVVNGLMDAIEGDKSCPFHQNDGLCAIHVSGEKPLGCHTSPFQITKHNKLRIKYRFTVLKCHLDWKTDGLPAYLAFPDALRKLFGETEAARITAVLDSGVTDDFDAEMPDDVYAYHKGEEATRDAGKTRTVSSE
jgi:hypothetical protein